nr:DUF4430 domain-containing protein [Sedimentibacter sp.]
MKFKITRNKTIAFIVIVIVLAWAFWYGGGAPGLQGWNVSLPSDTQVVKDIAQDSEILSSNDKKQNIEQIDDENEKLDAVQDNKGSETQGEMKSGLTADEKIEFAKKVAEESSAISVESGSKSYSESKGMVIDASTGKDKYLTDPVPEGKPIPVEPQDVEISDTEYTCTLSVRCDTILNNIDWLDPEKVELVPEDGVIYATETVTFYDGESVFNVLQREMKKAKIHMEFTDTPVYNSVYIEGINNLYEFDCGELSGWMYKVNDWFPNYGCSRYKLSDGDVIEWVYTCNLGIDVDGYYSTGS